MALSFKKFVKGIFVQNDTDRTKEVGITVDNAASSGTATEIVAKQTLNRTLELPDVSGELVEKNYAQILTNKTIDGDNNTLQDISITSLKTELADANKFIVRNGLGQVVSSNVVPTGTAVGTNDTQTLTNKTISGATNTITNVDADDVVVDPAGNLVSTNAQAALVELQGDIDTINANKVTGPASATDNAISRFDGTTGKLVQNSSVIISDTNNITGVNDLTIDGNAVVQGNLTVNGTTTSINTATLDVEDQNITVNKNGNDVSAQGAGLTIERTGTFGSFVYDSALSNKFKIGDLGSEVEVANKTDLTAKVDKATLTTKGDLYAASAPSTPVRLPVGTNGQVLTADSAETTGLRWGTITSTSLAVTTKTANYTAVVTDDVILCDSTTGSFTVNLYTAVGNSGKQITIKKTVLSNTVTIDANSAETIDGALTFILYFAHDTLKLISNGTNWIIESKKIKPFTCRVYKNAGTQTINNGANNKVTFDTASYDEKSMFDNANDRIVITRPGKYLLNGAVQMASGTGEARLISAIYSASDTVVRAQNFTRGNAVGNDSSFCSTSANFTAADNVSLFLLNDLGANYNVQVGEANTFLEVIEILD